MSTDHCMYLSSLKHLYQKLQGEDELPPRLQSITLGGDWCRISKPNYLTIPLFDLSNLEEIVQSCDRVGVILETEGNAYQLEVYLNDIITDKHEITFLLYGEEHPFGKYKQFTLTFDTV